MDTKKLRQKILDLAIRGKLVPQDPNDEPASVLLERIRAEKERLIKEGKTRLSGRQVKRSKKSASDTPHYENRQVGEANEVPFEVPDGWISCRFDRICSKFSTGPFGSMVHKADYVSDGGVPIVNPMNIVAGDILDVNLMMVSNEKAQELNRYRLSVDDILIARRGDLKKCAIVKETAVDWLCGTGSFSLHVPYVESRYIQLFYLSEYVQSILSKECVGATMDNLNQSVLGAIPFLLPPQKEQRRIISEVDKWFALIDTLETAKENLQTSIMQAKSKILNLAIHGKLVPQDPNDEPAIELLKRINPKFTPCDNAHKRNQIPDSWIWCTLQDSFKITMGSSPTGDTLNREKLGIEFHQGKVFFSNKYILPSDIYSTQPVKLAEPLSILLCVRAPVGTVNITDRQICIGRGLCSLIPSKSIDLQYAYYVLQTCSEELEQKATGSTFKAVGGDVVKNQIIPLPPINEQRRIVAKIEGLYSVLDEIQKSIEA